MDPQEVVDRLQIGELLARYVLAVDCGEWDLLDTVFTPDAAIDLSESGGASGDRETIKGWLAEVLSAWPGRQHLIGTVTVAFADDEATVRAAFTDTLAPARSMVRADATGFVRGGGWYHHRLVRTAQGWRSRELVQRQAWRTVS